MPSEPLSTPLTRAWLDPLTDDDGELLIRATCHPAAGLHVAYDRHAGTVTLACLECDRLVAAIVVQP